MVCFGVRLCPIVGPLPIQSVSNIRPPSKKLGGLLDVSNPLLFGPWDKHMKIHNTKSAAAETGFCERTMRRYAQKGIGPRFVLVGNRRIYTDEALREWLGAGGAA